MKVVASRNGFEIVLLISGDMISGIDAWGTGHTPAMGAIEAVLSRASSTYVHKPTNQTMWAGPRFVIRRVASVDAVTENEFGPVVP